MRESTRGDRSPDPDYRETINGSEPSGGGTHQAFGRDVSDRLVPGVVFSRTMTVTDDLAARHLITQGVKVFSTPEMVRFMERCVVDGLQPYLAPGENAVGVRVDITHLAPTPVGMEVTVKCTLLDIDRRKLTFKFEVCDAVETIGKGQYESFVVERVRQQQRIESKRRHRS